MSTRRDITQRKQAEAALRKERDRVQSYLNIAGVIIVAIDADQKVILINAKGCQILGYAQEEILGLNWFDNFIPERMRNDVKAGFVQLLAGKASIQSKPGWGTLVTVELPILSL